jgi:hypothetical protein
VIAVIVVAALAAAVLFVTREPEKAASSGAADPYRPAAGEAVLVRYEASGGPGTIERCEIEARGPGECLVRYRAAGARAPSERAHPLSEAGWEELLRRLARADFFEADEAPRAALHADQPRITLALSIGPRSHEVTLDGRRRATRDLAPVLDWFDAVRKASTPEPVSAGD